MACYNVAMPKSPPHPKVPVKAGVRPAGDGRKKRAVAVGAVLAPLVAPALARQGAVLAQIVPHWGALCPLLAAYSVPESVRGDVLTVAVASDGVKQELHYVAPQIIEGVNLLLGYSAISKVRAMTRHDVASAVQARLAPGQAVPKAHATASAADRDRAEALCKNVQDDDLRAALAKLGARVLKKTT